jgi:hypothetical protein
VSPVKPFALAVVLASVNPKNLLLSAGAGAALAFLIFGVKPTADGLPALSR